MSKEEGGEGQELDEKEFQLMLMGAEEKVRNKYHEFLLAKRVSLANNNGGRPVDVGIEDRLKLFRRAGVAVFYANIDLDKMEADWENAITADGRPPIKGAVDD
jgi:hypothetical protein